jgi:hypothetical protein
LVSIISVELESELNYLKDYKALLSLSISIGIGFGFGFDNIG